MYIDDFSSRMHHGHAPALICADMAKTIASLLDSRPEPLGYWDKLWASQAINGIKMSLKAEDRADIGLEVAMLSIDKLQMHPEERDSATLKVHAEVEAETKSSLLQTLQDLQAECARVSPAKRVIALQAV